MRLYKLIFVTLLNIGCLNLCKGQSTYTPEQKALMEIQKSHIDANVPNKAQFETFVKRDIAKYFYKPYGVVNVKWELLREGPTQSGVAYPKYYIWAKVYKNTKLVNEGAVRIEAIEKTHFDVTDFIAINEIKNNSKDIYSIFPGLVCEKIKGKIQ